MFAHGWLAAAVLLLVAACQAAVLPISAQRTFGHPHEQHQALRLNATQQLLASWDPPLSTRGRFVVDASGKRFPLRAGNWHGASGTYLGSGKITDPANHHAKEVAFQTPLGLDRAHIDDIADGFVALGLNTIRLPFSNEMLHATSLVPDDALLANPQLRGMTPFQVFEACVAALTSRGLAVILNNHTAKSIWCCGLDSNARWNTGQSEAQWQSDWVRIVRHFAPNPRVVGAELYNEVRRDLLQDPTWGGGGDTDWWAASLRAANRIQREASRDMLIVVGGINFVGIPTPYTEHYRPELAPVAQLSHALAIPDKLVYSSHFYAYTGPNATGADAPSGVRDPSYADLTPAQLNATIDRLAAYVATDLSSPQMHYTAPVWISEFGVGRLDNSTKDRDWWEHFVNILVAQELDFAYWPLVGWQKNGTGDGWALLAWDADGSLLAIDDEKKRDWRLPAWQRLIAASSSDSARQAVPQVESWLMLSTAHGSIQQSSTLAPDLRWSPGETKASCPDGWRLVGLSHEARPNGLCTDATFGRNAWRDGQWDVVADERNVMRDWAKGYRKRQCKLEAYAIGYSYDGDGRSAGLVCVTDAEERVRGKQRTVTFDRWDALPEEHGTFKSAGTAGACAHDEVMIGYAFDPADHGGWPAALLCATLEPATGMSAGPSLQIDAGRIYVGSLLSVFLTAWDCMRALL
jgi:hypothetical protein